MQMNLILLGEEELFRIILNHFPHFHHFHFAKSHDFHRHSSLNQDFGFTRFLNEKLFFKDLKIT